MFDKEKALDYLIILKIVARDELFQVGAFSTRFYRLCTLGSGARFSISSNNIFRHSLVIKIMKWFWIFHC